LKTSWSQLQRYLSEPHSTFLISRSFEEIINEIFILLTRFTFQHLKFSPWELLFWMSVS